MPWVGGWVGCFICVLYWSLLRFFAFHVTMCYCLTREGGDGAAHALLCVTVALCMLAPRQDVGAKGLVEPTI